MATSKKINWKQYYTWICKQTNTVVPDYLHILDDETLKDMSNDLLIKWDCLRFSD